MFKDAADFFDPLVLPYKGKAYTMPPLDYETGLALNGITLGRHHRFETMLDVDVYAELLGDAWMQMAADGVPFAVMMRAGQTFLADANQGREVAERVWEAGISPEALAAAKAAIQTVTTPTTTTISTSSGAATTTLTPDSTSGTNSQQATPRRNAQKRTARPSP